jgi:membrane protease YdiL (CAAX protease family)
MEPDGAIREAGSASGLRRSAARDLGEIALAYGLILLVIWTPRPWQSVLWWVAAAGVLVLISRSFEGFAAMGLRGENFLRSLWIAGAALLVAAAAVLIAAHLHTLRLPGGLLALAGNYCAYAIWAGAQQFLLQGFFLLRLLRLMRSPRLAALAAAVLFALAHMPSAFLVPLTLVWGFVACLLFLRYRNLIPLALAHAILGIAIAITIPGHMDRNMRVGLGYLRYGHHRHLHPHPPPLLLKPQ